MTPANTWLSTHFFYADDLTTPIVHWVSPLIAELRSRNWLDKYFFVRYWQGGPHIRLRLLPSPTANLEALKALLEEQTLNFVSAHPSTSKIDPQRYDEATARLSWAEYHTDQRVPLYPNNSCQYLPYEPEYHHYGGPAAMPHIETFFMASSDLAADLLAQGLTRNQATSHCLSTLLTAAALGTTDPTDLSRIFENYFQGWERMPSQLSDRLIDQFTCQYERQQAQIRTLVVTLLETAWHDAGASPTFTSPLARWLAAARLCFAQLTSLDQSAPLSIQDRLPGLSAPTSILLRCAHMHNNRLGVLLLEEAYLLFLLKQTLREIECSSPPGEESSHA